mgnify:FL=1
MSMVGGNVIETIVLPDRVWINCQDKYGTACAIYLEKTPKARSVSEGDVIWWQGAWAFWTPAANRSPVCKDAHPYSCLRAGVDYEIKLERIGFSGVKRPNINQAAEPNTTWNR